MERVEAWRRTAVAAVVVVSLAGMAVAVSADVPCKLDCAPDVDVTWSDALGPTGTGLSPPAFLLALLVAAAALGAVAGAWGVVGLVAQLLIGALMTLAGMLDAATTESLAGQRGLAPRLAATVLFPATVAVAATAVLALVARIRARRR